MKDDKEAGPALTQDKPKKEKSGLTGRLRRLGKKPVPPDAAEGQAGVQQAAQTEQAPEKPKKKRLFARVGDRLYEYGYLIESIAVLSYERGRAAQKNIGLFVADVFRRLGSRMRRALRRARQDLELPLRRYANFRQNLRATLDADPNKNIFHRVSLRWKYLTGGVRKYRHLARSAWEWLLPAGALVALCLTVGIVLTRNYALAVDFGGNNVAYVKDESVYESAAQMVKNRMVYTEEDEKWNLAPTLAVAAVSQNQLKDVRQLADTIVANSGEEIIEATGLYVDGAFYGATIEGKRMADDLAEILAPYQDPSDPTVRVEFVEDVEQVKGLYLLKNLVDYSTIKARFGSEVQGQTLYSIQAGDSPSLVASQNDLTLTELYAMNPGLEDSRFLVGEQLVVSQARSFLRVKVVRTVVRQENIPYGTTRTTANDLAFGTTQVVKSGVYGVREITEEIVEIDGIEAAVNEISNVILSYPEDEVVAIGTYVAYLGVNMVPGSGILMFPVPGYRGISRGFWGEYSHNGMDIYGASGTPIYAAENGIVVAAVNGGWNGGYGIYVLLDHGGGMRTRYAHCLALAVGYGEYVTKGQLIAYMGTTGNSTGNHCHFEVIVNGHTCDPMNFMG